MSSDSTILGNKYRRCEIQLEELGAYLRENQEAWTTYEPDEPTAGEGVE